MYKHDKDYTDFLMENYGFTLHRANEYQDLQLEQNKAYHELLSFVPSGKLDAFITALTNYAAPGRNQGWWTGIQQAEDEAKRKAEAA